MAARICTVLLSFATCARGGDLCPPDPETHVDSVEHWSGATNINGAVGNGGLSVGVSMWGEVTVLRWPSPSYYDQLTYTTVHAWPSYLCDIRLPATAPASYGRFRRPRVLAPNMGVFAGLYLFAPTLPSGLLTWFRDPTWSDEQSYWTEDSNTLVTTFLQPQLGFRATQRDFVLPDQDVLVRHYEIERLPGSPVTTARFIAYENMAPNLTKMIGNPVHLDDSQGDFAVAYSASNDALLHFLPRGGTPAMLQAVPVPPAPNAVDTFLAGMSAPGVYIAMGADAPSLGHQCGEDEFTPCSREPVLAWHPQGAYGDASSSEGALSGSPLAQCQSDGALSFPVRFDDLGNASLTLYLAFSSTEAGAFSLLREVRLQPWANLQAQAEGAWSRWISTARLPDSSDPVVRRVAKRALISIRMGQDRASSAIVASISEQPNYGEDWPRDGAFLNLTLDLAGYHDLVTRHNLFYTEVQRAVTNVEGPAGSWASNYYADGSVGLSIPFFEIDETGLALWSLVTHAKFLDDPCEEERYLEAVYPAIRKAAILLTSCKDPSTGLQCPASEDDNPVPTETLHGADSTYLGLVSALEAGRVMGERPEVLAQWAARAEELRSAILSSYDPAQERFVKYLPVSSLPGGLTCFTCLGRGAYWLIWPARVLPYDDVRIQNQAEALYVSDLRPNLLLQTDGFGYLNEVALAVTRAWSDRPDLRARVQDMVRFFFHDVPTPGTDHLGEVSVIEDFDGDGLPELQNRVAMPHLWKQAINYLLALAAFDPEAFDRVESPLRRPVCLVGRSWGCSSAPAAAGGFLLPLVGVGLFWRRRAGSRRTGRAVPPLD